MNSNVVSSRSDVLKPMCCEKHCIPEMVLDPYLLWDTFPCPPPWNVDLILEVNWQQSLGLDGDKVLRQLARRCNIIVPDVYFISGQTTSAIGLGTCDTYCKVAIVLVCLCFLFLTVFIVACIIYKKRVETEKPSQRTALNSLENKYYTKNGYPEFTLPSSMVPRHYETTLVGGTTEARLVNRGSIQNQYVPEQIKYGRVYWHERPDLPVIPVSDSFYRKLSEQDRTPSPCSSTDRSHIYECISDIDHNFDDPRENRDPFRPCSREITHEQTCQYYPTGSMGKGRRVLYHPQYDRTCPYHTHEIIPCLPQPETFEMEDASSLKRGKRHRKRRRPSSCASTHSETTSLSDNNSYRSTLPITNGTLYTSNRPYR